MAGIRNPDTARVGATIESFYTASLDESLWSGMLADLTRLFAADGSLLLRGRFGHEFELTWIQEHVPAIEGRWDHYMAYNKVDIRTAYGLSQPAPVVYVDHDFIDDRAMDRHPFYQEFMAAHAIRYTIGSRFPVEDGQSTMLNIFRTKAQGHHGRPEIELMQALMPHLARACTIDQRLANARRAERRLREALDRVPDAIFLVEPDGKIVDANHAADMLLRAADGLSAPKSRLSASHAGTRKPLADAIAGAAERKIEARTQALPIPRPTGGRPLQVLVMPLPLSTARSLELRARAPIVMVVVSDPDAAPMPLADRLAALWGLTPAEARLAAALANGTTLKDYTEQQGLSEHTVRWTSKNLLNKTDCRRQAEMVRVLTTAATFW